MKFDKDRFLFVYQNEYGTLKASQFDGLTSLIDSICADDDVTDPRHVAYMMATVKHECADTWQPISEYGKGVGHPYGLPDPETGLKYYGRGYVQLTWKTNYKAMSEHTGVDLVHNPDLAMQPKIAYKIMSFGMRKGTFTGVKLSTFINNEHCDFVNARKIINGLDCADRIAKYADTLLNALKLSEVV